MTTVLIWLGSGFAFGLGIVVGVWLMRKANGLDSLEKRNIEQFAITEKQFADRNGIAEMQAETLASIRNLLARHLKQDKPVEPT